jgi:hypothetical protein
VLAGGLDLEDDEDALVLERAKGAVEEAEGRLAEYGESVRTPITYDGFLAMYHEADTATKRGILASTMQALGWGGLTVERLLRSSRSRPSAPARMRCWQVSGRACPDADT